MRRAASPRLAAYAVLAGAGLVAALALRRPELAVLGAPFALVLAAGLRGTGAPGVEASFSLYDERVLEDEEVGASIVVRTDTAVDRLELLLVLPAGVEIVPVAAQAGDPGFGAGESSAKRLDLSDIAAGGASLRLHRVHEHGGGPGRLHRRAEPNNRDLHESQEPAHRGLRLGQVRLSKGMNR